MRFFTKLFAEAIGTFMLIFTIGTSNGDIFAVAGIIWVSMFYTTFISGALFNPAITISCLIKQYLQGTLSRETVKEYFYYTIIQFVFGMLGSILSWKLSRRTFFYDFNSDFSIWKAFGCELIYTFILCFNAHNVGKSEYGLLLEALIVVITVVTGAKTIGHISKNCLNPVVGLSMDGVYYYVHGSHINHLWVYMTSPMLGGIFAAFAYVAYNKIQTKEAEINRTSLIFTMKSFELEEV